MFLEETEEGNTIVFKSTTTNSFFFNTIFPYFFVLNLDNGEVFDKTLLYLMYPTTKLTYDEVP